MKEIFVCLSALLLFGSVIQGLPQGKSGIDILNCESICKKVSGATTEFNPTTQLCKCLLPEDVDETGADLLEDSVNLGQRNDGETKRDTGLELDGSAVDQTDVLRMSEELEQQMLIEAARRQHEQEETAKMLAKLPKAPQKTDAVSTTRGSFESSNLQSQLAASQEVEKIKRETPLPTRSHEIQGDILRISEELEQQMAGEAIRQQHQREEAAKKLAKLHKDPQTGDQPATRESFTLTLKQPETLRISEELEQQMAGEAIRQQHQREEAAKKLAKLHKDSQTVNQRATRGSFDSTLRQPETLRISEELEQQMAVEAIRQQHIREEAAKKLAKLPKDEVSPAPATRGSFESSNLQMTSDPTKIIDKLRELNDEAQASQRTALDAEEKILELTSEFQDKIREEAAKMVPKLPKFDAVPQNPRPVDEMIKDKTESLDLQDKSH